MRFFSTFLPLSFFSVFAVVSFSATSSYAGFKFVAPAKEETMMPSNQKTFAAPREDQQDYSVAVPSEPVMREELSAAPMAPAPLMMDAPMEPQKPMMQKSIRSSGLIIDPYPLGPHVAVDHNSNVSGASVHKAMNEESRVAHPMQLGRNMSTMTKPVRVASTQKSMKRAPSPRTNLIPMPGGMIPPEMPVVEYMDAVGFGRDLPVALALSQIVPPNYAYSFADDQAAGKVVSWEGGKPWDQVLDDMLAPQGLKATIEDKKVIISSAS